MKKNNFTFANTLAAVLFVGILLLSCSKESPENVTTKFKATDFEIVQVEFLEKNPGLIQVHCNVRNKTNRDYKESTENGYFEIYYKAKGSDGAWYDNAENVPNLNAGASFGRELIINPPNGINLDVNTFTYEVRAKK